MPDVESLPRPQRRRRRPGHRVASNRGKPERLFRISRPKVVARYFRLECRQVRRLEPWSCRSNCRRTNNNSSSNSNYSSNSSNSSNNLNPNSSDEVIFSLDGIQVALTNPAWNLCARTSPRKRGIGKREFSSQ